MKQRIDQSPAWQIGFLQGASVLLYILLLVLLLNALSSVSDRIYSDAETPLFAPVLFLLVFVFSALTCGSLVLGYPLVTALKGDVKRAVMIVVYSALTLLGAVLLAVVALMLKLL